MASLNDEQIKEFQEIYKEHFGTEISKEEARENGAKLLRLIEILYKPVDGNFVNSEEQTSDKYQENIARPP